MATQNNNEADEGPSATSQSSRQGSNTSSVWKYFTKDETGTRVTCSLCKSTLKYNRSTSALHTHLKKHPPLMLAEKHPSKQQSISSFTKRTVLADKRRQQITKLLVNFIIKDVRPLGAVHGEGFRELMTFFEPNYAIPSYRTMWNTIKHEYNSLRSDMAEEMRGKSVSLTTDLWTSPNMEPYITVTAHYITNSWELKARVLCTTLMPERHTAPNIAGRLSEIIEEWGIRVFCTVHDNASNMNLAMELCQMCPKDLGCSGHTLQLAIKSGLVLPDVAKTVDAARRVVSHFRHSALATCALKTRQEQLGMKTNKLQTDCPVRWNSTFTMLQRLFEQRVAVQSVLSDDAVTKPAVQKKLTMRASQWELLEQLVPVLQPLAKATEILCGELHVGLSFIYPVILNMVNTTLHIEVSDLTAVRAFKNAVRQQLETRFKLDSDDLSKSLPVVACMLDPRFKHLQFIPGKRDGAYSHLDTLLLDESEPLSATGVGEEDGETRQRGADRGKKARLELDFAQLFGKHYHSEKNTGHGSTAKEEARQYFLLPQIPTLDSPLQWWATNERRFPRLARLAKTYLAVPATSTPSERIFSLAGNTLTRQRASLHPAHVDELIFLHENMKFKTGKVTEEEEWDSE